MVSSEHMPRDLVKIYVARNVLEASMIRGRLAREGIECLIPGEDLRTEEDSLLEENAILVSEDQRDHALRLMEEVWSFFERPVDDADEGDAPGDA